MKVYRYMSEKEFRSMLAGGMLVNDTDHSQHFKTSSRGFCFVGEKVRITEYVDGFEPAEWTISPEEALEYLNGIVAKEFLVEFEAPAELFFTGQGRYAAASGGVAVMDELCIGAYGRGMLEPLRYKPFIGPGACGDSRFSSAKLNRDWYDVKCAEHGHAAA